MYFKTKNKEVVDTIKEYERQLNEFVNGLLEISKSIGGSASEVWCHKFTLYGFCFNEGSNVPTRFKKSKYCDGYIPYDNHALWQEINALRESYNENLINDAIGFKKYTVGNTIYLSPGVHRYDDCVLFSVPDDCKFEPPTHFELITKKEWDDAE